MNWKSLLVFFVLLGQTLLAVRNCPRCNYLLQPETLQCPKCLKLVEWPYLPPRTRQGRVIVRTGKDAFIRHPSSQNRAWKSSANAGADLSGQIGTWGFVTGLRYLVCFDVSRGFADAGIDLIAFRPRRVWLRLVVADNQINQQIPVRVYPLSRPFQEGSGRFHIRSKNPDGATWNDSAPMLSWHVPGGDYHEDPSATGILGADGQKEAMIDVSAIYRWHLQNFQLTGKWEDFGMIIMRDAKVPAKCSFLTIYSFESKANGAQVLAPQLFFE